MCIIPLLGGRLCDICAHLYYRIPLQQLVLKHPRDLPQDAPGASLLHQIDHEARPLADHFQGDICGAEAGAQRRPCDRPVCPGVLVSSDDADPGHATNVLDPGLDPARRMAVLSVRRRREDEGDATLVVKRLPRGVEGDAGVMEAGELDGCRERREGVGYGETGLAPEVGDGGCGERQWGGERGGHRAQVVAEGEEREGDLGLHLC